MEDLIRRGSAHPEDLARLGELLEASGRRDEAGDWFKKAVQQAGTTANDIPTNLHAIYGMWLWKQHEFQSAIPELLAALKHPGQPEKRWTLFGLLAQAYQRTGDREDAFLAFANAYFSNPYQVSIWRDVNTALTDRDIISAALLGEHSVKPPPAPDLFLRVIAAGAWDDWDPDRFEDSAKLFVSYADALEAQGLSKDSKTFRTLAAMGALKTGMRAVRVKRPDKGLQCFAFAEGIVPLDKFKLDVQVTVLRDMALAYGKRGELTHAMATAEKLIPMCKPDEGRQTCTLDGIASVPFPSNYDQNRDTLENRCQNFARSFRICKFRPAERSIENRRDAIRFCRILNQGSEERYQEEGALWYCQCRRRSRGISANPPY
jgi:tetratricopeptide (TPR) repeat protein